MYFNMELLHNEQGAPCHHRSQKPGTTHVPRVFASSQHNAVLVICGNVFVVQERVMEIILYLV